MDRLILRNEFGSVLVALDEEGNGPRLLVRDLETGHEIRLDVLEVESLTRLTRDTLTDLVRPQ